MTIIDSERKGNADFSVVPHSTPIWRARHRDGAWIEAGSGAQRSRAIPAANGPLLGFPRRRLGLRCSCGCLRGLLGRTDRWARKAPAGPAQAALDCIEQFPRGQIGHRAASSIRAHRSASRTRTGDPRTSSAMATRPSSALSKMNAPSTASK
jgi:hypothetical protein